MAVAGVPDGESSANTLVSDLCDEAVGVRAKDRGCRCAVRRWLAIRKTAGSEPAVVPGGQEEAQDTSWEREGPTVQHRAAG